MISTPDSLRERPVDSYSVSDAEADVSKENQTKNALDVGRTESQLIFDNAAYQNEPTLSLSGSDFNAELQDIASQDNDVSLKYTSILSSMFCFIFTFVFLTENIR